jgi:alpha-beta hydrolase superfamily lysophospholipase
MPGPTPIYFGDTRARLFGWLHRPSGPARATAALLCNPLGDDIVRAHRSLRHLAEDLCSAGFAVMRFDFHGTGDSAGSERDPGRVAAWRHDVGTAIDELRARTGADRVAIVGLRLGATIAADVASRRDDVASVVLWHPFLDGASFTAETMRMHTMHRMLEPESFAAGPREYADGAEALGFFLTNETITDLRSVDLLRLSRRPARDVLVIGAANTPSEEPLLERLRAHDASVSYRHLPGHKFLIAVNHRSEVPQPIIDEIVRWLGERHPGTASAAAMHATDTGSHESAAFSEEPVVFGTAHRMFGVLVKPRADRARIDRPAVILTNAGTVHRIGPHRLYVELARELADLGFYVLRLDLSGIGDSEVGTPPENLCYPATGLADCQEGMTAIASRLGIERFIIAGLCSGGDIAFQLGLQDPRVAGVVMMNPRTFCVHDLALVDALKGARYYQTSMFKRDKWLKLLRGEVDIVRVARMVAPKIKSIATRSLQRALDRFRPTSTDDDHADVPECLRVMAEGGVDTFLLVSVHDPGVDYVDVHFGKRMRELTEVANYRREDLDGTDHTFTSVWAQRHVRTTIREHLAKRHLT